MEYGKSTTVAGLLRAGYRYATDETTVVDRRHLTVTPYPKSLALSQSVVRLLGVLPRTAVADETPAQVDVRWWDLGSPGVTSGGRVDLVVFPAFRHGSSTVLEPVAPAAAVVELAASTFRLGQRARQNLELLARLATAVPVYRLAIGNLDEAVHTIDTLVSEHTDRSISA